MFEHATTFGSLIQVPEGLVTKWPALKQLSEASSQDLFVSDALKLLEPLVQQTQILTAQYDAVVANPPYMGGKAMNPLVKKFATDNFPNSKSDLFAVSTERFLLLAKDSGYVGLMTPFTWMFLKSYESLRGLLLDTKTLQSLIQPEYHAFFESAYVPVCTFVIQTTHTSGYDASFIKLEDFYGAELQPQKTLEAIGNPDCGWLYRARPDDFKKIPGCPVAYWVSKEFIEAFDGSVPISEAFVLKNGLQTGDTSQFLRCWWEVGQLNFARPEESLQMLGRRKWFPCNKAGEFRKWFGNCVHVVNWESDGRSVRACPGARPQNVDYYFQPSVTWG